MRTYLQAKAMAKSLRESLAARQISLTHSECLEIIARQFGFGDWNVLAAKIDLETGARDTQAATPDVELHQLLPVLRVSSREAARAFYIEVLGFQWDWGDEAADRGRAFYAQISRDGLQMHLTTEPLGNGHAAADVYFRMQGIDTLHDEIAPKLGAGSMAAIHATFYDARELAIQDPFGNVLRFVEINPPGVAGTGFGGA